TCSFDPVHQWIMASFLIPQYQPFLTLNHA
uniref:Uncharacterized protein n=1 Tax=Amphimedon queenslandica TaxID=400682 RepID=A0A1X7UV46_AMPQE